MARRRPVMLLTRVDPCGGTGLALVAPRSNSWRLGAMEGPCQAPHVAPSGRRLPGGQHAPSVPRGSCPRYRTHCDLGFGVACCCVGDRCGRRRCASGASRRAPRGLGACVATQGSARSRTRVFLLWRAAVDRASSGASDAGGPERRTVVRRRAGGAAHPRRARRPPVAPTSAAARPAPS